MDTALGTESDGWVRVAGFNFQTEQGREGRRLGVSGAAEKRK